MPDNFLIGLDFGSESARGVLLDAKTGAQRGYHVHPYRHGVLTASTPGGQKLSPGFALQVAADYLEAAEMILKAIGGGKEIAGIGIDFTASSPLPALADGRALSEIFPDEPHAYVKLWKHAAAQPFADEINRAGGAWLKNFGGKLSGEWLLAKAEQIAAEAPEIWRRTEKFIESGDWLVWRLTGVEARSLDFAAYKAQFDPRTGYPERPNLAGRLAAPRPVGSAAGALSAEWRARTGVRGEAIVAVAVIDSHVALPAVGGTAPSTVVGALGTSAAYLALDDSDRPMPSGIEGRAFGAALPKLWCYEAGQPAFGDVLAWFVRAFPRGADLSESFAIYNREAAALAPGDNGLVAIDWWNGNRVPFADKSLAGLIAGFTLSTRAIDIYRALLDSLCFGARLILDRFQSEGLAIQRIVLTSGLAKTNPFLLRIMTDVLGQPVHVPEIDNPTCVGAAIHGAVASGIARDFEDAAQKFAAREFKLYEPDAARVAAYQKLYTEYLGLTGAEVVRAAVRNLR